MPLLIKGKVTDASGLPIPDNIIEVKEIPPAGSDIGTADVWADADGNFTLMALSSDSTIQISSVGFETQEWPATSVPAIIRLNDDPRSVINGTRKKDNTLAYVLGTLAAVGLLYAATRGKKPAGKKAAGALPAAKKPTIKKVSV